MSHAAKLADAANAASARLRSSDLRAEIPPNPIERAIATGVVVDEEGAVGLEHEQPNRLRQPGGQPTGVPNLAACDE
jgi:hypothetical protein